MADEKKNPLFGAFRTPAPGTAPPAAALSGKLTGEKKSAEPAKTPADSKAAPVPGTAASAKSAEPEKKAGDAVPKNLKVPIAPEDGRESVIAVKLSEVHPFESHSYSVREDEDIWNLVESVKRSGVIEPIMVGAMGSTSPPPQFSTNMAYHDKLHPHTCSRR